MSSSPTSDTSDSDQALARVAEVAQGTPSRTRDRLYDPQADPVAVRGAIAAIKRGVSIPAACHQFGMRPSRLRPAIGAMFARAAAEARSVVEGRLYEHATKPADKGDWRAAQAYLQGHPSSKADWGQQVDVRRLDDAALLRLIAQYEAGDRPLTEDVIDAEFQPEAEEVPLTEPEGPYPGQVYDDDEEPGSAG